MREAATATASSEATIRQNTGETTTSSSSSTPSSSRAWTGVKFLVVASTLLAAVAKVSGGATAATKQQQPEALNHNNINQNAKINDNHRRLSNANNNANNNNAVPSYMQPMMKDLAERQKLFDDTPPEEVKYWFEYTGPLQKYYYRFSKSRGKADYFEGRDDSGVVSARYIEETGGTSEFRDLFMPLDDDQESGGKGQKKQFTPEEQAARRRLLENCLAMGSAMRPQTGAGTIWNQWFGGGSDATSAADLDRCRILFSINMVGAGRGTTMLWETNPPPLHTEGPFPWQSEQETASSHLQRNLEEIDAMCETGLIAARVQILVCEQIHPKWMEWIDSHLTHCGGKAWPLGNKLDDQVTMQDRPSPVQVVVAGSAQTAERCHDLKSGFMDKRMQDLIIAPPIPGATNGSGNAANNPSGKPTDPSLVSSDNHDLYVGMKWSSLVTLRAVSAFLQASADIAAAASSSSTEGKGTAATKTPASPFVIPSFVRVSYVSEENSKPAKWRMHGDFFHPAAWEICKDSFDVTWIPNSLSGANGVNPICPNVGSDAGNGGTAPRKLGEGDDCGQWWVYFTELQMPTSPEVYANEVVQPLVQGGSNGFYMVTERHRVELAESVGCREAKKEGDGDTSSCGPIPQAVIPLGDLESFLINYTPNTALGKKHVKGRRPGYSHEEEREAQRKLVKERKQLHGEEDIEKALFDYTVYPAALFHKDATVKAARDRDAALTSNYDETAVGPQTCKSSYYDITITKPRPPVLGWCQAMARRGLCTLYADYFRLSADDRCVEACGLKKNFTPVDVIPE